LQAGFLVLVLMSYGIALSAYWPWKSDILNAIDVAQSVCMGTFITIATSFLEPSTDSRGIYSAIMVCILFSMLIQYLYLVVQISSHVGRTRCSQHCWYIPFVEGWTLCQAASGPPEGLSSTWRRVCDICATLPEESIQELLTRMLASDWDALSQSVGAWHALAPDIFPKAATVRRLESVNHSLANIDGKSNVDLVAELVGSFSKVHGRECSTVLALDSVNSTLSADTASHPAIGLVAHEEMSAHDRFDSFVVKDSEHADAIQGRTEMQPSRVVHVSSARQSYTSAVLAGVQKSFPLGRMRLD